MANQPTFVNLIDGSSLAYYGLEGVDILLQVDDSVDNLITIQDEADNIIGEKFHRLGTGTQETIRIYPQSVGTYSITATASDVNLSNTSPEESVDQILVSNLKENQVSMDVATLTTKVTFLDLNFWFYHGCKESNFSETMIQDLTAGVGGYNMWDDYQEADFLPNIFSSSTIFKLLYTDNLLDSNFIEIQHKIRNISKSEFNSFPSTLSLLLDTYYNINTLWITTEDLHDEFDSILIDRVPEIATLEILRDSKKFTYGTDGNITSLPLDESVFLSDYYDQYDSKTPLEQAIIIELYYLHYNLDDDFDKYTTLLLSLTALSQETSNKNYNLMVVLYSYLVLNKIVNIKILGNVANTYAPDFWSNI